MPERYWFLSLLLLLTGILPAAAQRKLKTENVVLVTLDGFRWRELFAGAEADFLDDKDLVRDEKALRAAFWDDDPLVRRRKLLPFVWSTLAAQGQLYGNRQHQNYVNLKNRHRFSYPGYHEILAGFADDNLNSNDKINNPNQTVLEFINGQRGFRNKVAAFASWDVFPYILNTKRSNIPVNAGYTPARSPLLSAREKLLNQLQQEVPRPWPNVRYDAFTHHYALEYLQRHNPRVLFIGYGETDDFAHDGDYEGYLRSAHQADAFLRELWTWLQSTPHYRNKTTLIVTTDHGRGNNKKSWKTHGFLAGESDQTWLLVLGPDTQPLGEVKAAGQYYADQVAKTLAAFLGLHYDPGRPVGPVLETAISRPAPAPNPQRPGHAGH